MIFTKSKRLIQITLLKNEQGGNFLSIKKGKDIPKDLKGLFKKLDKIDSVERVIPGEIKQKRGNSPPTVKVTQEMESGVKVLIKKGGLVQEAFVTTKSPKEVAEKVSDLT